MRRKSRGMFRPAKHRKLAKIVTFETVKGAKKAAQRLLRMFNKARTRKQKVLIKRATVLAANRAKVSARRRNLRPRTKKRLKHIAEIYRKASKKMEL